MTDSLENGTVVAVHLHAERETLRDKMDKEEMDGVIENVPKIKQTAVRITELRRIFQNQYFVIQ